MNKGTDTWRKEINHSQDPGVKVRIILLLNKYVKRVWAEFIWLIRYIPTIFPL